MSTEHIGLTLSWKTLEEIEDEYILTVLKAHNWNRTKSAKVLGIHVRTMRNRIKKLREQNYYVKPAWNEKGGKCP